MFDLDAYLARIGLHGHPSVQQVHLAHVTSIPFENLDPYCGIPVSLAVDDLERKLVSKHRGGYCFEQNLLLKAGLEALGAEVDLFPCTCAHRRNAWRHVSPFVKGVIVSAHTRDGRPSMLRDWGDGLALKEQTPAGTIVTPVALDAVPNLLSTRFGLPGYAVDADGELIPVHLTG